MTRPVGRADERGLHDYLVFRFEALLGVDAVDSISVKTSSTGAGSYEIWVTIGRSSNMNSLYAVESFLVDELKRQFGVALNSVYWRYRPRSNTPRAAITVPSPAKRQAAL